jgi:hypothetical protein
MNGSCFDMMNAANTAVPKIKHAEQSALNVRADVLDVAQEAQDATIWP